MSSAISYDFKPEYAEEELADLLLIWLWCHAGHMIMAQSHVIGQNGGDYVQNGRAHMANFKSVLQGHFFMKNRNN